MDNKLLDTFLQLLRIGLWQKGSLDRDLNAKEWTQIYQFASIHTVEGIIYDSFSFLKDTQLPPQTLLLKWTVRVDQIERLNAKMNDTISYQFKDFKKHDLDPILQKGQGVAACYIKPEHRVCGDIDWYFQNNGYSKAREYLKKQQISYRETAGLDIDYNFQSVPIEHHQDLFHIRSPFKHKYLNVLEKKYQNKQQSEIIKGTGITLLAPELQILQINAHILKHMISFGIGYRQICDAAMLYRAYKGQVDNDALKHMYKKAGILKWVHVLHHLLENHMGLEKKYIPFEYPKNITSDWMLNEIWHGGNFGHYDDRYVNGKVIKTISVYPDGAKRLWGNFKRYFPYAPQEAIFLPILKLYAKIKGTELD